MQTSTKHLASLCNRHILVGISGGIAAYKAAELVRRLVEHGAYVRVVMTDAAREFITPLTLQALSGFPVSCALLDETAEAGMGHIELARWADVVLVAPASANFMARLAHGQADDLLATLCLATVAPVILAPAMNQAMWANTATQTNVEQLLQRGIRLWGPAAGLQACGDVGFGRLLEVNELVQKLADSFDTRALAGKRVLISAGPTREALDPVRYISNNSSGKMGFALAQACIDAGALTTLVTGPVNLPTPARLLERMDVVSALQMHEAVLARADQADIFIATAAVADYRPAAVANDKIKKSADDVMTLTLIKNPDIVAAVAALDNAPFTVGFAAETCNLEHYARDKLQRKKLNMVVMNDVSRSDIGFNSDNNAACAIWPTGMQSFACMSKTQLAAGLIELLARASAVAQAQVP